MLKQVATPFKKISQHRSVLKRRQFSESNCLQLVNKTVCCEHDLKFKYKAFFSKLGGR